MCFLSINLTLVQIVRQSTAVFLVVEDMKNAEIVFLKESLKDNAYEIRSTKKSLYDTVFHGPPKYSRQIINANFFTRCTLFLSGIEIDDVEEMLLSFSISMNVISLVSKLLPLFRIKLISSLSNSFVNNQANLKF